MRKSIKQSIKTRTYKGKSITQYVPLVHKVRFFSAIVLTSKQIIHKSINLKGFVYHKLHLANQFLRSFAPISYVIDFSDFHGLFHSQGVTPTDWDMGCAIFEGTFLAEK